MVVLAGDMNGHVGSSNVGYDRMHGVWSMKYRVPDQEVDQRKLGERLWKKTVRCIN